jgi:hypothetical protein
LTGSTVARGPGAHHAPPCWAGYTMTAVICCFSAQRAEPPQLKILGKSRARVSASVWCAVARGGPAVMVAH